MDAPRCNPTEKHCSRCCRRRPVNEFRRVRAGVDWPRRASCRECRNASERAHRERQRQRKFKRSVTALGSCKDIDRLEAVVGVMLQVCGGVDGLAAELVDLLQQAAPGSVTWRRIHLGILNALSVLHQQRVEMLRAQAKVAADEHLDVESLSDEDLLDSACEPVRRLHNQCQLGTALRHLVSTGEISRQMLMHSARV